MFCVKNMTKLPDLTVFIYLFIYFIFIEEDILYLRACVRGLGSKEYIMLEFF